MNAEQHTGLGNSCFSRPDAKKNRDIVNIGCKGSPYLIFVMNAVNAVGVHFWLSVTMYMLMAKGRSMPG